MGTALGTGVPAWPQIHPGYDWSPLLVVLASLLVASLVFGIRLTARTLVTLVVGGTLVAWLSDAIGLLPSIAVGLLGLALGSAWLRRSRTP